MFRGNHAQVKEYQELLEAVIFHSFEGKMWTRTCKNIFSDCQSFSCCDGPCMSASILQPLPMTVIFPLLFIKVVLLYSSSPHCVWFPQTGLTQVHNSSNAHYLNWPEDVCSLQTDKKSSRAVWQSLRSPLFRSTNTITKLTSSSDFTCLLWASEKKYDSSLLPPEVLNSFEIFFDFGMLFAMFSYVFPLLKLYFNDFKY